MGLKYSYREDEEELLWKDVTFRATFCDIDQCDAVADALHNFFQLVQLQPDRKRKQNTTVSHETINSWRW